MYGHPKLVKQWAKIMKPDPIPAQVERARQMREAKARKAAFLASQGTLEFPVAENPRRPVGGTTTRKENP